MIIEKATPGDEPALRELWQEAFSDTDGFLDEFFSLPYQCLAAKDGEAVVGAAYWFHCICRGEPMAYLYAVATRKTRRGEGICTRLLKALHTRLAETCRATLLVPGEEGLRSFYRKLGYRDFGGRREITVLPGSGILSAEALTVEEYARRRRELLPLGGVEQVGNTLPFLESFLQFYGGEGWLLAGSVEAGVFTAPEFLGDPRLLGDIFHTLNLPGGSVYVAGETPFGMYCPIMENVSAPTYFAFALD